MADAYEHLWINKEAPTNKRRTRKYGFPTINREDLISHGKKLNAELSKATDIAKQQAGTEDNRYVLKLLYSGVLDFNNLEHHGIEFISQEDKHLCIVFTSEEGLVRFSENLLRLGIADTDKKLNSPEILLALEGVDTWTSEDRKCWALKQLQTYPDGNFLVDVELWPIGLLNSETRNALIDSFERWLSENAITIADRINRDSLLMYRLKLNSKNLDLALVHRDVRQIDLPPRSGITYEQLNLQLANSPETINAPPQESCTVCILDSGINTNHPLLKAAVADAQSFIEGLEAQDDVGHGTAVAGIALHGDLEARIATGNWNPEFWLCSGKILYNNHGVAEFNENTIEGTIEKAVIYFVKEWQCKIFNLSIGNENSPYDQKHIRGIAYTLDRLAREYDLLFIVSAGNFRGTDNVPATSWRADYPDYLLSNESTIIDPAPALNVITVGALASHTADIDEQRYSEINYLSPAAEDQPSPFTRHGKSIRGAIKPDLMAHGGNKASAMRFEENQTRTSDRRLGVLTLNHQFLEKLLLTDTSGTSFAAPYITHLAAKLLNSYPSASANLLRALLINHANVPSACYAAFPEELGNRVREVVGYGKVDEDTLYRSTEYETVLITEDVIANDRHQFYELPLPKEFLRGNRSRRQLRITLAYSPAVRTTRLDYVATRMSFVLVKGHSIEDVSKHFDFKTRNETKSIGDSSVGNREISATERKNGTVQSSIWSFQKLSPRYKWFVVVTRNDKSWGKDLAAAEEKYALVATVNDKESQQAQLYTQIRERIRARTRVRI